MTGFLGVWSAVVTSRSCVALCGIALLASVVATGCSRTGPAVEFVEGKVLLNGEPLADAMIGYSPAESSGLGAFGRTDAVGMYKLTTARGATRLGGAPIGSYVVTVRKYRNRLDDLGPQPDPSDAQAAAKWQAEANRLIAMPPDSLIPEAYGDKATSGLKATVKPGRNVGPEFTFELKSDFKGG
jgi:hypothetical protein